MIISPELGTIAIITTAILAALLIIALLVVLVTNLVLEIYSCGAHSLNYSMYASLFCATGEKNNNRNESNNVFTSAFSILFDWH